MTESERIRKNSFYSTLTISSRLIANVFIFWIIARYYGPKIFGQFTTAQVLATNFIILADFGFDLLLITEIAKQRSNARNIFIQFFSLKIIFCLVALISMILFGVLGSFSYETKSLILILSFYTLFSSLTNFLSALFKGFEQLKYETKLTLFMNIFLVIITLPLIFIKADIKIIASIFVLTRLIGFVIGVKYSKKILPDLKFTLSLADFNKIKSKMLTFGLFLVFNNLFFQLDTILLSLWKDDNEVGIYQAVFKLIMLPLVIPDIFSNTLIPVLSRLNTENYEQWKKTARLTYKLLIAVVVPISIVLFMYAEPIIKLIYGGIYYKNSVPILKIFSLILFSRFSFEAHALMLTTSDKQYIRLYTVVIATLVNLLLNFYLIPIYGSIGAAIVSLITNILVGIIYFLFNFHVFNDIHMNKKIISYLLLSFLISFFAYKISSFSFYFSITVICFVFILIIYFFYLTEEEKKLILYSSNRFEFFKKG